MKTLASIATVSYLICTFLLPLTFETAFAEETPVRLSNPFLLPQTNFFMGNARYRVSLSNSDGKTTTDLDSGGINAYGFELEVNQNSFLNIGAYFRVESQSFDTLEDINRQFTTLLGGFTRFFYMPPFLKGNSVKTQFFARLELGGGPTFLGAPNGLVFQTGGHVGIETYFNRWIGLSLSCGQVYQYGRETIVSGQQSLGTVLPQYQNATIWNSGQLFLISLKTTVF
jgi:hypothetical protein